MGAPVAVQKTHEALQERLGALREHERTVGGLLEMARMLAEEIPASEGSDGHEVSMQFETFGHTSSAITSEIVWRWSRADVLEARPLRLRLRFDVDAGPNAREVEVRSRNYPHPAAFVTAAIEAAELDPAAPAKSVRVELDVA